MAAPSSLLRGELYKADQMGAIFKLRWVELWAGGKGERGRPTNLRLTAQGTAKHSTH